MMGARTFKRAEELLTKPPEFLQQPPPFQGRSLAVPLRTRVRSRQRDRAVPADRSVGNLAAAALPSPVFPEAAMPILLQRSALLLGPNLGYLNPMAPAQTPRTSWTTCHMGTVY